VKFLWSVRNGRAVCIVAASNGEAAKSIARSLLRGDKDLYVVEQITKEGDIVGINLYFEH